MHKVCSQTFAGNLNRPVRHYFHKLKPFVVETGHEFILLKPAQDHNVCLEGIAVIGRPVMNIDVRLVGMTIGAKPFSMDKSDRGACFSPDPY